MNCKQVYKTYICILNSHQMNPVTKSSHHLLSKMGTIISQKLPMAREKQPQVLPCIVCKHKVFLCVCAGLL